MSDGFIYDSELDDDLEWYRELWRGFKLDGDGSVEIEVE